MQDITVTQLKERMDAGTMPKIIDVREEWEYQNDHIEAENIPLGTLPMKIDDLSNIKDAEIVVTCRSGGRSGRAAQFMRQQGFANVRNLTGGMLAWKEQIDPGFNVE